MSEQTGEKIPVATSWQGVLSAAYDASVSRWMQETDAVSAEGIYRTEVFPLTCERIRETRPSVPGLDLLFVPVGTQPFAPILGIIANPSECVALLETPESRIFGLQVENSLQDGSTTFLHVKIDGVDITNIAEQMKAVFDSRGLPSGARVGADITGGRKPMTAAIAGVGSLYGWRMFYVEAEFERGRLGYGHHERVIELPNVLEVFGTRRRELVFALVRAGAYSQAAAEIEHLIEESVASADDRNLLTVVNLCGALKTADSQALVRALEGGALATWDRVGELRELVVPSPARVAGLSTWAASINLEQSDSAAAMYHAMRAQRLLGRPEQLHDDDPVSVVEELLDESSLQEVLTLLRECSAELERALTGSIGDAH